MSALELGQLRPCRECHQALVPAELCERCDELVAARVRVAELERALLDVRAAWLREAGAGDGIREEDGPVLERANAVLRRMAP